MKRCQVYWRMYVNNRNNFRSFDDSIHINTFLSKKEYQVIFCSINKNKYLLRVPGKMAALEGIHKMSTLGSESNVSRLSCCAMEI